MSSKSRVGSGSRSWPKRALALFVLIVAVVYALVFFSGSKSPTPKLGIDLQGGTRVTLVPQGAEPTSEQLAQARTILEQRVNGQGVSGAEVVTNGNTLVITVPGEDTAQAQAVGQTSKLLFRPVMAQPMPDTTKISKVAGDMANRWVKYGVLTADEANARLTQLSQTLTQAGTQAEAEKVTEKPLPEPSNSIEEAKRRDEVTAMLLKDRQSEDVTTLSAAATLLQCTPGAIDPLAGSDDPSKPLASCDSATGQPLLLEEAPLLNGISDENGTRLTGNEIDTDKPINGGLNPQTGQMEISFAFKTGDGPSGSQTWADLTQERLQQQIAITLDSAVISAPVIQGQTPYGSSTSITGSFTQAEAQSLANNLKYGALPLSFVGENGEPGGTTEIVPPSLGKAALEAGLIAGIVGLILILIYSVFYMRALAVFSILTLIASAFLTFGTLVLLGRWIGYSLDLSGIAGLIIGIGATADSFVVYYERIKDELLEGRTFRSAVRTAWERSRATIVTGNAVTLIGAVVVYLLAIGEVKGFAFTMGLTTAFDLVVSFLVMAPLMQLIASKPAWAKPAFNGLGGIFNLVEERREQGFYAKPAKKSASTETAATPAAKNPATPATPDTAEKEN
ncbi:protein translocase subunit SecD [Corynebacterium phoceense]|uniref:protein translocase subunit SecD n=1 Tax=Corynebacterium phoceense TaxID=1686286 RepID=UPI001DED99F3|nr:protein translocase subunit SecD [Corynebacterium phoceense]HJG43589.1 protein translocase subunit SecD [Corynebacterium phoceense]